VTALRPTLSSAPAVILIPSRFSTM